MLLYKYFKPGCYPCITLTAILKRITLPDGIEIVNVDASLDENKSMVGKNQVVKVPVLLFEDGRRLDGVKPKIIVEKFINGDM